MTREEVLYDLRKKFKDDIIEVVDKSPKRVYIEIKPESLIKIAEFIFKDLGARFNIASGVDGRFHIEILYHFTMEEINLLISLRVKFLLLVQFNRHFPTFRMSISSYLMNLSTHCSNRFSIS